MLTHWEYKSLSFLYISRRMLASQNWTQFKNHVTATIKTINSSLVAGFAYIYAFAWFFKTTLQTINQELHFKHRIVFI